MEIKELMTKLDRIVINKKEFKEIRNYRLKNNPDSQHEWNTNGKFDKRMFFPLNTFVLDCDCVGYRLCGLMELQNFDPMNFTFTDEIGILKVNRVEGEGFKVDYDQHDRTKKIYIPCSEKEWLNILIITLTSIMVYIIDKAEDRRNYERLSTEAEREQRENYEYHERECFLLNDIVKYVSIHPNRKSIQYRCECWGVRGHLRHLKNGEVIFIKPFKKGRKRDVLEPKKKDYLLGGKNDV